MKKIQKTKADGRTLLIVITAVLLTGILAVGLLAKYRSDNQKQAELIASQFHFSSDYLEEGKTKTYEITDWMNGFDIQLYNYEKENEALISADDIEYQVQLSDPGKWGLTDNHNGEFKKDEGKTSQTIRINPQNGVNENDQITVTVTTTKPFKKTLSATFVMKGKNQPDYTIVDKKDGTMMLTIQSNSYSGDINIQWPSDKYVPDNTDPLMESWTNSTKTNTNQSVKTEKNTTYELLFFKKTTESVTSSTGSGTQIILS